MSIHRRPIGELSTRHESTSLRGGREQGEGEGEEGKEGEGERGSEMININRRIYSLFSIEQEKNTRRRFHASDNSRRFSRFCLDSTVDLSIGCKAKYI